MCVWCHPTTTRPNHSLTSLGMLFGMPGGRLVAWLGQWPTPKNYLLVFVWSVSTLLQWPMEHLKWSGGCSAACLSGAKQTPASQTHKTNVRQDNERFAIRIHDEAYGTLAEIFEQARRMDNYVATWCCLNDPSHFAPASIDGTLEDHKMESLSDVKSNFITCSIS